MRESVHPVPPTRPQQVYRPGPPFIPARPVAPQFTPAAPPPVAPPQHRAPQQSWWTRQRLIAAGIAVVGGIGVIAGVIAFTAGSSQSPYVSQLQSDGYTLVKQGGLTGGEGVGYAEGDNAAGGGELVVQAKSAADAQATANGMQGGGFDVTTQGDMLVIQSGSYSAIQELVANNNW
jgi:hypothetical protein